PHRPANHQLESDRCPRIRHGHSRNHLFPLDSYHKCNFGSSVVKVGYTELGVNSSTACSVSSSERYSLLIDSWLKYRREAAVHSSCCSWRTAPARRITAARSEERRGGKEGRSGWAGEGRRKKSETV